MFDFCCKCAANVRLVSYAFMASYSATFLTPCTHDSSISSSRLTAAGACPLYSPNLGTKGLTYIVLTSSSLSRINYPADCPLCCVCRSGSSRPSRRLTRPGCQCCPPTHASSTTSASHHPPLPPSDPPSMWARRARSLLSHCRSDSFMHPFMHPFTHHLFFPGVFCFSPGSSVSRPAGQHAAPCMQGCLSWLPCHACFAA